MPKRAESKRYLTKGFKKTMKKITFKDSKKTEKKGYLFNNQIAVEKTKKFTPIGKKTVFVFYNLKTGVTIFQYIFYFQRVPDFQSGIQIF